MSKYSKLGKLAKNGAVDSKYFGNPEQFEKDVQDHRDKTELFKEEIRKLILLEPCIMEIRIHDAIEVLRELKEKYNI